MLRLATVRSAGDGKLLIAPVDGIESAAIQKGEHLERLGAGAPVGERISVARRSNELVVLSYDGRVYSMLGLSCFSAGYDDIELVRLYHILKYLNHPLCVPSRVALHIGEDGIQVGHGLQKLVVKLLVGEELRHRALAIRHHADERVGARNDAGKTEIKAVVAKKLSNRPLPCLHLREQFVGGCDRAAQAVVERGVIEHAPNGAARILEASHQRAGPRQRRVHLVVERSIGDELAERSLAL